MVNNKRLTKKNKKGGSGDNGLTDVVTALLDMKKILFLPSTQLMLKKNYNKYLNSVDSKTLLHLVQENNAGEIEPIKKIFGGPINESQDLILDQSESLINNVELIKPDISNLKDNIYYKQFLELNTEIENINMRLISLKDKIKADNYKLRNFKCVKGLKSMDNNYLTKYILDCSDDSVKNNDWFKIIINAEKLDDAFNIEVTKSLVHNDIRFDENKIKGYLKFVEDNSILKNSFKNKLIKCSKNPSTYFENLRGIISFKSLDECQTCHSDCLLYLNDQYRSFLMKDIEGLGITQKIKMLIYCEYRIYQFSKYLTIEAKRINDKNHNKVIEILKNLKEKNKKNLTMKKNKLEKQKQREEEVKNLEQQKIDKQKEFDELLIKSKDVQNQQQNVQKLVEQQRISQPIGQQMNQPPRPIPRPQNIKLGQQPMNKPMGQQPMGQQPMGQQPMNKPMGQQPMNKPMGQQPMGQQPMGQQPMGQQPIGQSFGESMVNSFGQTPGKIQNGGISSENLMKQNILSQIIQVINDDDSENNTILNKFKKDINNKPFGEPVKPFDRLNKPFGEKDNKPFGGPNKPFGEKDNKPFGGPNKPFGEKDNKPFDRSNKPFGEKDNKPFGGPNKPFGGPDKPFGGPDKPFGGPNKPFGEKDNKPFGGPNKPFGEKDNKPFDRPNKPFGEKDNKPFGGPDKPFGEQNKTFDRPNKPFGGKDNKPFGEQNKPFGESVKPFDRLNKPFGEPVKSFGEPVKPFGGPNKPFGEPVKPFGEPVKPFGEPVKPFGEPVKPFGEPVKPFGESVKPFRESVKPFRESVKPFEESKPSDELIQKTHKDPYKQIYKMDIDINTEKDDILPDCTAISQDIINGRIKKNNFKYLAPQCDKQIMNALLNS